MGSIETKLAAKRMNKILHRSGKKGPKPGDTSGEVKRIEGNIAYVRFQGSEIDTPVNISIACSVGDNVRVRVGDDHKAWTLGNASAPPTDDRVANVARRAATNAVDTATKAEEKAVEAEYNSESALSSAESAVAYSTEAKQIAGKTNQYFWHKESVDPGSEDETGAHITEVPQEEWEDPNSEHYHSGGNLLARSNGIAVRDGLTELASFGTTMRIGRENSTHFDVGNTGINAVDENGNTYFEVNYDPGSSSIGQSIINEYTYTIPEIALSPGDSFSRTIKNTLKGITDNSDIIVHSNNNFTSWSFLYGLTRSYSIKERVNCLAYASGTTIGIMNNEYHFTEGISDSYHFGAAFEYSYVSIHCIINLDCDMVYNAFTNQITTTFTVSQSSGTEGFHGRFIFPKIEFTAATLDTQMRLGNTFSIDSDGNEVISGAYRGALETITPSITASKGTLVSAGARRFGQVVQLWIQYRNTSSTASGANIFEGTLNTTDIRPAMSSSGVGYYGAHAMVGYITAAGAITIRNASSSAVSISSTGTSSVSLTYLVN